MRLRGTLLSACFSFSTLATSIAPALATTASVGAVAPASVTSETVVADQAKTATPIKHLVVIFNENVSFDHYFGTYPSATNPPGEPKFTASPHTPSVNDLVTANLLTNNPNDTNKGNGVNAANPFRLDRTQAATADQNHSYTPEQQAYNNGKADLFPKYTGDGSPGGVGAFGTQGQVMGYYDGNTVTALWNYAQHFALNDNFYNDAYGPSTPGALEVVSGNTNGLKLVLSSKSSYYVTNATDGSKTLINDVDPAYDACASKTDAAQLEGKNIGDLLNAAKLTWGGFMGGFDLSKTNINGTTGCARSTNSPVVIGDTVADYIPHHNWFQYYPSTANPTHARPAALTTIGYSYQHNGKADPANHEYDLSDFYSAVKAGNYPSVSYIKLPAYQDAHAGYSDPLDEQAGLIKLINFIQQQPDWKNTAIVITYDDSDGWYDHRYTTPTSDSHDAVADQLNGRGLCGKGAAPAGLSGKLVNGRCGPGTRLPFLVISPWVKANYVSDALITQAAVVTFIEDNWLGGERLGGGSFDTRLKTSVLETMFDFSENGNTPALFLNPNGTVKN